MAGTPMPTPRQQFFDGNGNPLANGTLRSYIAGTTTPVSIYQDAALASAHPWPAELDAYGRITVFLDAISYKFELRDSLGATIYSQDNIPGVPGYGSANDITGTAGENLAARDVVCISDGSLDMGGAGAAGKWVRMNATSAYLSVTPVLVGVAPSAITAGASGTIRLSGVVSGYAGLSTGATYYASTSYGGLTSSRPQMARIIGMAVSSTQLLLAAEPRISAIDYHDPSFLFGGSANVGRQESSYPAGATGDKLVPGSSIVQLRQSRLGMGSRVGGAWKFRGMLATDSAASSCSVGLYNLDTATLIAEITSASTVGALVDTGLSAVSFDFTDDNLRNFGAKIKTNNELHNAYAWGLEVYRERP